MFEKLHMEMPVVYLDFESRAVLSGRKLLKPRNLFRGAVTYEAYLIEPNWVFHKVTVEWTEYLNEKETTS